MPVDAIFHCHMCGLCCEGKGGIVVSPADMLRLALHLAMPVQQVRDQYCEIAAGKLKIRCGDDGYCIFFNKRTGCRVHAGKPSICRAWPFFRGNLEDPTSLAMAKEFCPGINAKVTHADFVRAGYDYLREHKLLASDASQEANALILE